MNTATFRKDLLAKTDKATRHRAIDSTPKLARRQQAMFVRFSTRLAARVAKAFPDATLSIEHTESMEARKMAQFGGLHPLRSTFWVVKKSKIIRSYIVTFGYDTACNVLVEKLNAGGIGAGSKVVEITSNSRTDKAYNQILKMAFGADE